MHVGGGGEIRGDHFGIKGVCSEGKEIQTKEKKKGTSRQ